MIQLVKVRTLYDNNIKYYRINGDDMLQKGAFYVGSTRFGSDLVEVHCPSRIMVSESEWQRMLKELGISEDKKNARSAYEPVLHYAAKESEIAEYIQAREELEQIMPVFKEKADAHSLSIKIMKLHYTYRKEKLVCFYTAEQRVDFRSFVKDIGAQMRMRIEMFQISPRDAMSLMDTCGICGRRLCCLTGCNLARFSGEKGSYNIKTPGICGKGRCCNYFEIPVDFEPEVPEMGGYVVGDEHMYTVLSIDPAKDSLTLSHAEGEIHCSFQEIRKVRDGDFIRFEYCPQG